MYFFFSFFLSFLAFFPPPIIFLLHILFSWRKPFLAHLHIISHRSFNVLNKFIDLIGLHDKTKFTVQLSVYSCILNGFTLTSIKCSGECNQQTYSRIDEEIESAYPLYYSF